MTKKKKKKKLNSLQLHLKKFCHTKIVGDRVILIAYLDSAWKNTQGIQISFHLTKIIVTSVSIKHKETDEWGLWNWVDKWTSTNKMCTL